MHTFIDLCEGEELEIVPTQYPTGHGIVYALRVEGSGPGTTRFGSTEHIKKFVEAAQALLKMSEAEDKETQLRVAELAKKR